MRGLSAGMVLVLLLAGGCGVTSPRFASREKPPSTPPPASPVPGFAAAPSDMAGVASYYADDFHGRKTANGETYDMHGLTAAHRTLPFNTMVKVTNLDTNMSVVVRINDRGPFKDDRVIDLSLEAAKKVGLIPNGTGPVRLEIVAAADSLH